MDEGGALREHILQLLRGGNAHPTFEGAAGGFPLARINQKPGHLPYSAWGLLEHLRIAQHDILDFMVNPAYQRLEWPKNYWPTSAGDAKKWHKSVRAFEDDLEAICDLARSPKTKLYEKIPRGGRQTYLRESLLGADHKAYHLGQLIMLRRLLDVWE